MDADANTNTNTIQIELRVVVVDGDNKRRYDTHTLEVRKRFVYKHSDVLADLLDDIKCDGTVPLVMPDRAMFEAAKHIWGALAEGKSFGVAMGDWCVQGIDAERLRIKEDLDAGHTADLKALEDRKFCWAEERLDAALRVAEMLGMAVELDERCTELIEHTFVLFKSAENSKKLMDLVRSEKGKELFADGKRKELFRRIQRKIAFAEVVRNHISGPTKDDDATYQEEHYDAFSDYAEYKRYMNWNSDSYFIPKRTCKFDEPKTMVNALKMSPYVLVMAQYDRDPDRGYFGAAVLIGEVSMLRECHVEDETAEVLLKASYSLRKYVAIFSDDDNKYSINEPSKWGSDMTASGTYVFDDIWSFFREDLAFDPCAKCESVMEDVEFTEDTALHGNSLGVNVDCVYLANGSRQFVRSYWDDYTWDRYCCVGTNDD